MKGKSIRLAIYLKQVRAIKRHKYRDILQMKLMKLLIFVSHSDVLLCLDAPQWRGMRVNLHKFFRKVEITISDSRLYSTFDFHSRSRFDSCQ